MTYLEERRDRKNGLAPALPTRKEKKAIPKIGEKKKAENNSQGTKDKKAELEKWFDDIRVKHWDRFNVCSCMECGSAIMVGYSRHATAHLLPKKQFPSVATHELNYLILGAGCGCHDRTHRVDTFIKMKVWSIARERLKILIPLLPIDELRKVSNQLLIAIDNVNP